MPEHRKTRHSNGTGTPRQDLGEALWRLSDLVRADERRRSFRAKAYRRAVWSLDDLAPDLSDPPERALSIPGIGTGVLRLIEEFRGNGTLEVLERLEQALPRRVGQDQTSAPNDTPAILRALKGGARDRHHRRSGRSHRGGGRRGPEGGRSGERRAMGGEASAGAFAGIGSFISGLCAGRRPQPTPSWSISGERWKWPGAFGVERSG